MIILMEKARAREDIQCVAVQWVGGLSGSLWVRPSAHAILRYHHHYHHLHYLHFILNYTLLSSYYIFILRK